MGISLSKYFPCLQLNIFNQMNCTNCFKRRGNNELFEEIGINDDDEVSVRYSSPKLYSWDLKPKLANRTIEGITNSEIVREKGSINGDQIVIVNCKNSQIYLLDHIGALNIDDCEDCIIITGPVRGSVFLRDTTNSTLSTAASQLRLRDCKNIHLFAGAESEPIIESSYDIHIAPYTLNYKGIDDHFRESSIDPDKLIMNSVYDFTPPLNENEGRNWNEVKGCTAGKFLPVSNLIQKEIMMTTTEKESFIYLKSHHNIC